jgi:hypothetical protein
MIIGKEILSIGDITDVLHTYPDAACFLAAKEESEEPAAAAAAVLDFLVTELQMARLLHYRHSGSTLGSTHICLLS